MRTHGRKRSRKPSLQTASNVAVQLSAFCVEIFSSSVLYQFRSRIAARSWPSGSAGWCERLNSCCKHTNGSVARSPRKTDPTNNTANVSMSGVVETSSEDSHSNHAPSCSQRSISRRSNFRADCLPHSGHRASRNTYVRLTHTDMMLLGR